MGSRIAESGKRNANACSVEVTANVKFSTPREKTKKRYTESTKKTTITSRK